MRRLLDYGDSVLSLDCDAAQLWGRLRVPISLTAG
jgi:hypothetical protein